MPRWLELKKEVEVEVPRTWWYVAACVLGALMV